MSNTAGAELETALAEFRVARDEYLAEIGTHLNSEAIGVARNTAFGKAQKVHDLCGKWPFDLKASWLDG